MKKLLLAFTLIFSLVCAAETPDETVKARRGDSWESIASRYGISPEELKEANGGLVECYLGMNVVVPGELIERAREERRIELEYQKAILIDGYYEEAERLTQRGELKKAVKVYDKIIETEPSAHAYYFRGLVEYEREKWRRASNDLNMACTMPEANAEMKKHARDLAANADALQEQYEQNRNEMIAGIVGLAATATATAIAVNAQQKANKEMASAYSSGRRSYSSAASARSSSSSTVRRSSSGYSRSGSSTRRYSRQGSQSSGRDWTDTYTDQVLAQADRSYDKALQTMNKYFTPEAFAYNYMNGLPTMPGSQEMGLAGIDAYAYDLQSNLAYRQQLSDLEAAHRTKELIEQGVEMAKKEIADFSSIYGREPSQSEIQAIFSKHTQGYLDAYKDYVTSGIELNNELGLGKIDRTKVKKKDKDSGSSIDSTSEEGKAKAKESETTTDIQKDAEDNSAVEGEDEHPSYGRYIQRKVNIYQLNIPYVLFGGCKVYEKGSRQFVLVRGSFYPVRKSTKLKYNREVKINNSIYYFNL